MIVISNINMKIETIGFAFNPKKYWGAITAAPKYSELMKVLTDAGASSVLPVGQASGGSWRRLESNAKLISSFNDVSLSKNTIKQRLANEQLDKYWSIAPGLTVSGQDDAGTNFNYSLLVLSTPQSAKVYITNGIGYPTGVCISGSVFPPKKLDKTLIFIFNQIRPQLADIVRDEMSMHISYFNKKLDKVKAQTQRIEDLLLQNMPMIGSAPTVTPKSIWD